MNKPFLTIVLPVYNVKAYLREALESLLNQSFNDFEIIAINDGSDDGSGNMLDLYAEKDNRITVIHQKNMGLSAARNRGLQNASGNYIYFFDSDDVLEPGALDKMITKAKETDSDIVHFSAIAIDENGRVKNRSRPRHKYNQPLAVQGMELFKKLVYSGNYATNVQKYLFNKDFIEKNGLKFDDGYIHEDESFTIETLCLAQKATSLEEPLLKKRFRSNSIMSKKKGEENLEGWTRAASRLMRFKSSAAIDNQTAEIIDKKIEGLLKNSLKVIYRIKIRSGKKLNLNQYLTETELRSAGWQLKLKAACLTPYMAGLKIYSWVNKKFHKP